MSTSSPRASAASRVLAIRSVGLRTARGSRFSPVGACQAASVAGGGLTPLVDESFGVRASLVPERALGRVHGWSVPHRRCRRARPGENGRRRRGVRGSVDRQRPCGLLGDRGNQIGSIRRFGLPSRDPGSRDRLVSGSPAAIGSGPGVRARDDRLRRASLCARPRPGGVSDRSRPHSFVESTRPSRLTDAWLPSPAFDLRATT